MADPNLCIYCDEELDGLRSFQRDLEGNGAHCDCLDEALTEMEEDLHE